MSGAQPVTDATFDEQVLASPLPVVVDFTAEWCGPCRLVGPVLDELAETYAGAVRFVTVDADTNPALVARYGIVSLPTLQFVSGGELVDVLYGARPKAVLNDQVRKLLAAV
ncbi:Thioredoxin 1 [Cellulomonas sp. T2.31MG-18]|uniref:thioredoxin n=1 Tax=Cellulomonas sp. T2.31MG-18 TaxID=3157619 RepID=UPI0035EF569B